ncbi:pathogenicity protein [Purpureocillium lavendulum]|uniref:Protein YOP1 n=1 Tax=Purpureocillium lavendulum TaxID=1247861 RepID=A0AB34FKW8_9HYPO|nr:pathogenicity protein [Purpureocillium lavendulum]
MFDIFAMLLSSIASFLFPIFASYKALKTSDPAQLTPWLMYWVVFSCCLLVESWFNFILFWIPFYGYLRLLFFLYLILPQTQGARVIYEEKIHPFLEENENSIDEFIASSHNRLKAAGSTYFRQAIEYLKTNILGLPPSEQPPVQEAPGPQGYTQSLLARFSVPTTRWGGVNTGNDFYNFLASAVTAAAGAGSGSTPTGASRSGSLIPPNLREQGEKLSYLAAQRERINMALSALEREEQEVQRGGRDVYPGAFSSRAPGADDDEPTQRPGSGLTKSRSETDFEKVEAESGAEDEGNLRHRQGPGGSWMPWGWGTGTDTGTSSAREE